MQGKTGSVRVAAVISSSHYFKARPRIDSDSLLFTIGRFSCLCQSHRRGQIGILSLCGFSHAWPGHFFPKGGKRRSARPFQTSFPGHLMHDRADTETFLFHLEQGSPSLMRFGLQKEVYRARAVLVDRTAKLLSCFME